MSTKTRSSLEKLREEILSQIRMREPDLMRELEAIDLAIANLDPDQSSTEYARYVQGIDAVEAYLRKKGRAARGDVVAQEIVAGGWRANHERASRQILESIRYHTQHAEKTKRIKQYGDDPFPKDALIGLYEWDDSYFQDSSL